MAKIVYRMFWKNVDFPEHSEGPILVHRHTSKDYFTKAEADERCIKLNSKSGNSFTEKEANERNTRIPTEVVNKGDLKIHHWVKGEKLVSD